MKNGNFALSVVGGVEDTATGTVTLPHQQVFRIELTNHLPRRRCNVRLSFNGRDAGEFRVPGGQSVVLARPANDAATFTFLQVGTSEAKAAGLALDGTAGVIRARFLPEASSGQRLAMDFSPESIKDSPGTEGSLETTVYAAGPGGAFQEADDIFSFDTLAVTEVEVRLQGTADPALSIDPHDALLVEIARMLVEIARLEAAAQYAQSEFDYDRALDIGQQLRAKHRQLGRLEGAAELERQRQSVEALQANE